MERWDRSQSAALTAIVDGALPAEGLSEDELLACLWDDVDPTLVVGDPERGVAAGVVRDVGGGRRVGFVQLLAVVPPAQRQGLGRALVRELERWAFDEQGATSIAVGGGAPFYLWPGVDVFATPALCLFEALGYSPLGAQLNMGFPTGHRAPVPDGAVLRRALEEADVAAGLAFVERHWPNWVAETRRAIEHGTCHLAFADADGAVVGFGCHSVNRLGWLGPMGTDPTRRHGGLGDALLGAIATDLMATGLHTVEVAWVGPLGFYANAAGATVSHAFRTLVLRERRAPASA
jgi:GNAT superfamily N-acetyltransferase